MANALGLGVAVQEPSIRWGGGAPWTWGRGGEKWEESAEGRSESERVADVSGNGSEVKISQSREWSVAVAYVRSRASGWILE